MKVNLSKVKLAFLLALLAAFILCAAIAFAGLFGAPSTVASADSVPADEVTEETTETAEDYAQYEEEYVAEDNEVPPSDNATSLSINSKYFEYDYMVTLDGTTCYAQAQKWALARHYSHHVGVRGANTVYVKMTQDWIAAPVSGNVYSQNHGTPQRTSFSGYYDNSGTKDVNNTSYNSSTINYAFHYGSIAVMDAKIILDLNGHTISRNLSEPTVYGSVFYITNGSAATTAYGGIGNLTIVDSTAGYSNDYTKASGKITGGYRYSGDGGGIYIDNDGGASANVEFSLYNGSITGNKAQGYGGGIFVDQFSSVKLIGGLISNNYAYSRNGSPSNGGGIYLSYRSSLEIHGSTAIIGNTAGGRGGGIGSSSPVTISGVVYDSTISGNTASEYNNYYLFGFGESASANVYWQYSTNNSSWTNVGSSSYTKTYDGSNIYIRAYYGSTSNIVQASTSYKAAGTYTIDCGGGYTNKVFTLNINKRAITAVSGITVTSRPYDGTTAAKINVGSVSFTGKISSDTLTLGYTSATYADANAGTSKTVTVSGLSLGGSSAANYTLSISSTTTTGAITAYKTSVIWTNTSLEYNGSAQKPTAAYRTYNGTSNTSLTVSGTGTDVGSYTSTVTNPTNYEFSNTSVSWKVTPKRIEVTWGSTTSFEYNGAERAPTATYSGLTITVKGAINVGTNLTATATCSNSNYQITNPTKTFSITKKSVAINWVGESGSTSDFSYTYNGTTICPTAYFTDASGTKVNLTVTGGQTNASSSNYTATASTTGYTANYTFTGSATRTFTIGAMSVSVVWENTSFTYDGNAHDPTASYVNISGTKVALSLETSLTGNKNAGTYTAQAKAPTDANYQITAASKTHTFTIAKAAPKVTPAYGTTTGLKVGMDMPSIATSSGDTAGTISWATSSLAQGTKDYIWVFIPTDTTNYNTVTGTKSLTVAAADGKTLSSISATAAVKGVIYANTSLTDLAGKLDIVVTAAYTDGSSAEIAASDYEISKFDKDKGEVTVRLKSDNTKTAVFKVYVTPQAVTKIVVTYTANGDKIYTDTALADIKTVVVKAYFNDGGEPVTLAASSYSLSGSLVVGKSTVVVSYTAGGIDYKDSFEVTVSAKDATLTGVTASFAQSGNILVSTALNDITKYGTLTVKEVYSDGNEIAATTDYTLSVTGGKLAAGLNTVTLTYTKDGKTYTTTFTVFAETEAKAVIVVIIGNKSGIVGAAIDKDFKYTVVGEAAFAEGDLVFTTDADKDKVGKYEISGEYKGDAYDVTFVKGEYVITENPAAKQVTVVISNATSVYGEAEAKLEYTVIGLDSGETLTGVTLTKEAGADAGEYAITGAYSGSNAYGVTFIDGVYTITAKAVTIAIDNKTTVENAELAALTFTVVTSGVTIAAEDVNLTTNANKLLNNTYKITGSYVGSKNYEVTFVEGVYTVVPQTAAGKTIIIIDNKASVYGEAEKALTFTVADGTAVAAADVALTKAAGGDAGEYAITGVYVGSALNADDVMFIDGVYTVTPKVITVTINNKTTFKGADLVELTSDAPEEVKDGVTLSTTANVSVAGEYGITGVYTGSKNYEVKFVNGVYTVKEISAAVTYVVVLIDDKTSVAGDELSALTFTVITDGVSIPAADIRLTCAAEKDKAGSYAITGKYIGSGNYVITFIDGEYTVTEKVVSYTYVTVVIDGKTSVEGDELAALTFTVITEGVNVPAADIKLTTAADKDAAGSYAITGEYVGKDSFKVTFVNGEYVVTAKTSEISLTYKQNGEIYSNMTAGEVKGKLELTVSVDGTETKLTASDYTLTADLANGKATVTYTVGGVSYTEVITVFVTAQKVTSIKVTYSSDGNPVYTDTKLADIKTVTVVANFNYGDPVTLNGNYQLSGNLVVGTSTVVVSYSAGGVTYKDSFEVTVSAKGATFTGISASFVQSGKIFSDADVTKLGEYGTLTVEEVYSDGAKKPVTTYTLSAADGKLVADQTEITVTYEKDGEEYKTTFKVFVTAKEVAEIKVEYAQGETKVYPESSIHDLDITVRVKYNDGTEATLNKGDYALAGKLAVGESTLSVSYTKDGKTVAATFTVTVTEAAAGEKIPVSVNWADFTFTFDGNEHKPVAYYYINGSYEVRLAVTVEGENVTDGKAVNVGTYTAKIDAESVYDGYKLTGNTEVTFTITEAGLKIEWIFGDGANPEYDGEEHLPKAYVTSAADDGNVKATFEIYDAEGNKVEKAVAAGSYVAKLVIAGGGNYRVDGEVNFSFTIAKAKVEKQPETAVDESKKFDSTAAAEEYVKGLYGDRKVTVNAVKNENGEIEVTVTLEDDGNYEWKEGGDRTVTFKFGTASVAPAGGLSDSDRSIMIALICVMIAVAVVSIVAMIIALKKPKKQRDSDGFYEAYQS